MIGTVSGRRLVQKIRQMIELTLEVRVNRIYWEAYRFADHLASRGCSSDYGFGVLEDPPLHMIFKYIEYDIRAVLHSFVYGIFISA